MRCASALVFAVFAASPLAEAKLGAPGGPRKLHYEVVDTFMAMQSFPYSVAIWDPDNDELLQCVAANRTEIDPVAQTATFVCIFPETEVAPMREIPFYVTARGPGRMTFTLPGDPTIREGALYYLDPNCVVLDVEFNGHRKALEIVRDAECVVDCLKTFIGECIMWVVTKFKDSVPPMCIDRFVDTCGAEVPEHSRDLCYDGEGDY